MNRDEFPDATLTAEGEAAAATTAGPSVELKPLPTIEPGNYQSLGEHGRGGIGVVHRVRDLRLDRIVAIKELQEPSAAAQARFEREMRITARLQHPGIVPIHECGRWPDGSLFYAMKLVEGRSLRELIDSAKSLRERLALLPSLLAVADTMAYAHKAGIVHRDLKPANVIVGEFGETVVIDWGLAKDVTTGIEVADHGPYREVVGDGVTVAGQVVGTPAYMAPEQARGERVDARADVYALGAMLFNLLAGRPPQAGSSKEAVARAARGERDIAPSEAPRDLVAIVDKALASSPADRYADGSEFAAELRRYAAGQLVQAHEYSFADLAGRWLRAHRALVVLGTAALLLVVAVAALGVSGVLAEQENVRRERDVAEAQRRAAEEQTNELLLEQAKALVQTDPTQAMRRLEQHVSSDENRDLVAWLRAEAEARGVADKIEARVDFSVKAIKLLAGSTHAVIFEDQVLGGGRLLDLRTGRHERVANGSLFMSPDRRRLAWVENKYEDDPRRMRLELWHADAPSFEPRRAPGDESPAATDFGLARGLSPSGRWFGIAADYPSPSQWWFDFDKATWLTTHHEINPGITVAIDDLGPTMWFGGARRLTTEGRISRPCESWASDVQGDPSRRWFLHVDYDGAVEACDVQKGRISRLWYESNSARPEVTMDDRSPLALLRWRNSLELHDLPGSSRYRLELPTEVEISLAVAHATNLVAVGTTTGQIYLWTPRGNHLRALRAHRGTVRGLDFSDDGRDLASVGSDGDVRIWKVPAQAGSPMFRTGEPVLALKDEGDRIRVVGPSGFFLWSRTSNMAGAKIETKEVIRSATFRDETILVLDEAGVLRSYARESSEGQVVASGVESLAGNVEGTAFGFSNGDAIRVVGPGARDLTYRGHDDEIFGLYHDGRFAIVRDDSSLGSWPLTEPVQDDWPHITKSTNATGVEGDGKLRAGALSADGVWLLYATDEGKAALHIPLRGEYGQRGNLYTVGKHQGGGTAVAFDHTETWAASGGIDGVLWLRHDIEGRLASPVCRDAVVALAGVPGQPGWFVASCTDGTLRFVDAVLQRRAVLVGHRSAPTMLRFSTDGSRMVSVDGDGEAWEWNLDLVPWREDPLFSATATTGPQLSWAEPGAGAVAAAAAEARTYLPRLLLEARARSASGLERARLEVFAREMSCTVLADADRRAAIPNPAELWARPHLDAGPDGFRDGSAPAQLRYTVRLDGSTLVAAAYADLDCDGIFSVVEARQPLADPSAPIDWHIERPGE